MSAYPETLLPNARSLLANAAALHCREIGGTEFYPFGEIANRCGFPVPTHLNALFRRTFGTTLRAYRTSSHIP